MVQDRLEAMRIQSWNRAVESFGTAFIFESRARRLRWLVRLLTGLGLVLPVFAGAMYMTFGGLPPVVLGIVGVLAVIQVVGSAWSLNARWDDSYSYCLESMTANYRLADSFERFARNPPDTLDKADWQYELLESEDRFRQDQDLKQGVSEKEKRKGMRAGLRKFKRECPACGSVPVSMEASDCDVCGNF